jgi:hypothetical protein
LSGLKDREGTSKGIHIHARNNALNSLSKYNVEWNKDVFVDIKECREQVSSKKPRTFQSKGTRKSQGDGQEQEL